MDIDNFGVDLSSDSDLIRSQIPSDILLCNREDKPALQPLEDWSTSCSQFAVKTQENMYLLILTLTLTTISRMCATTASID